MEFSIPMLLGNLAQQLYNTADSVIVGHYVGDNALAAVGSASPILNLLLALFVGISTGAGIVVSQSFGARDREGLSKAIGNCIALSAIATVVIMVVGPLITMPMLKLLGTPASIIGWCAEYLNIYFLGIVGFFFYNMLSGILRGLGDSMSALGFLLIAAALNVVLDLWFVQDMGAQKFDRVHQGVKQGGLIATAFATTITVILLLFSPVLFRLFTQTPELIDLATRMIRIMAVGYICISVTQVLGGVMRGAGDTVSPMWISFVSTIFIRVPLAYGLAWLTRNEMNPHGQPIALFGSLMISWVLGMILSVIVFSIGKWK